MDEKLLAAALKAYGIGKKFVLSSAYYEDRAEVVIVTRGGAKVRYHKGDEVEKLDPVRVTGINPRAKKRKPITGGAKKKSKKKAAK